MTKTPEQRHIESARAVALLAKCAQANGAETETMRRLANLTLFGGHANVIVRIDAVDYELQADWLIRLLRGEWTNG